MRRPKLELYSIILVLITSCVLFGPKQEPLPEWIDDIPSDSTHFYSMGVGDSRDKVISRNKAVAFGWANLAMMVKMHIRNFHELFLSQINSTVETSPLSTILHRPDFPGEVLVGSTVVDTYSRWEGASWRTYALIRVSMDSVHEAYLDYVRPLLPPASYDLLVELVKRGYK